MDRLARQHVHSVLLFAALAFATRPSSAAADAPDAALDIRDAGAAADGGTSDAGSDASGEADEAAPGPFFPLPPVPPAPDVRPVLEGRETTPTSPVPERQRPVVVIQTILGLLLLATLAYVGGHPRVRDLERRIGISQVITAGFPFVVLGMLARAPSIGILSDPILAEITPVLRIGLAWIGFVVGFRFDARLFSGVTADVARIAATSTALPFALSVGIFALWFRIAGGTTADVTRDGAFVRDAVVLATAGAMSAKTNVLLLRSGSRGAAIARITRLEELAGVVGLAVIGAYFRPGAEATWSLPGTGWVLVTLGLGSGLGLVVHGTLLRTREGPELTVLVLGTVAFTAGMASSLRLSPVVVGFLAAVLLANFPGGYKDRLAATLRRLERPIYFLSLVVIGALWHAQDWRGWLLGPVFAGVRFLGKWVGANLGLREGALELAERERRALAFAPMGPLAIAIVVDAELLHPARSVSLIVATVLVGAIFSEVVVQVVNRASFAERNGGASEEVPR